MCVSENVSAHSLCKNSANSTFVFQDKFTPNLCKYQIIIVFILIFCFLPSFFKKLLSLDKLKHFL